MSELPRFRVQWQSEERLWDVFSGIRKGKGMEVWFIHNESKERMEKDLVKSSGGKRYLDSETPFRPSLYVSVKFSLLLFNLLV